MSDVFSEIVINYDFQKSYIFLFNSSIISPLHTETGEATDLDKWLYQNSLSPGLLTCLDIVLMLLTQHSPGSQSPVSTHGSPSSPPPPVTRDLYLDMHWPDSKHLYRQVQSIVMTHRCLLPPHTPLQRSSPHHPDTWCSLSHSSWPTSSSSDHHWDDQSSQSNHDYPGTEQHDS